MCQAGYIHKLTSKRPYQHPFIFCCFEEDDFVNFIEQFDKTDFTKYKKLHYNESRIYNRRHQYSWDGFNKSIGIKTEDTPTIQFDNGIQIIYPHVHYDKFDQKYKARLERFNQNTDKEIYFILRVRRYVKKSAVDRFYRCKNVKKIILFDEDVYFKNHYKENENTKIIITNREHHYLVSLLTKNKILENF